MSEICSLEYINDINNHRVEIDPEQFRQFYEYIKSLRVAIFAGEGRSGTGGEIGLGGINPYLLWLVTTYDVGFPGKDFSEAIKCLENIFGKTGLIVNSGSGETSTPKQTALNAVERIKKGDREFKIAAVCSDQNSTIARAAKKYGYFLEVKGREESPKNTQDFWKTGIMNDIYELLAMLLFQKIKEGINGNRDYQWVLKEMEREMEVVGKLIDKHINSGWYSDLIEKMAGRASVAMNGVNFSRRVAKMTGIRAQHVKEAVNDRVYLPGSSSSPRIGDILLLISFSGGTPALLEWLKKYEVAGIENIYSVVGNESELSKRSNSLIIDEPEGIFHLRTSFLLSPLPAMLVVKLAKGGRELPEHIVKIAHGIME